MSSSASVRVVATTPEGGPRVLLSLAERKNGDLMLIQRGVAHLRDPNVAIFNDSPHPDHKRKVSEMRLSVHRSLASPLGVNIIKQSLFFEDGSERTSQLATFAIKKNDLFVPILSRRLSGMEHSDYDMRADAARIVELGRYEDFFSLIFSVFIGPRKKTFRTAPRPAMQFQQIKFTHFRVVLMWSFLSIPHFLGYGSGEILIPATIEGITGLSQGSDEAACMDHFDYVRADIHKSYVAFLGCLSQTEPTVRKMLPHILAGTYFREGISATPAFRAWAMTF